MNWHASVSITPCGARNSSRASRFLMCVLAAVAEVHARTQAQPLSIAFSKVRLGACHPTIAPCAAIIASAAALNSGK